MNEDAYAVRPRVHPEHDPDRELIRQSILRLALKRSEVGMLLLSRKGWGLDWQIDLRPLFLERDLLERIADMFWERYQQREPFQLGTVETAGIPLLTAILLRSPKNRAKVNGFVIRKERKTVGRGNLIEGRVTDEPIVLVDDLINSASSVEKGRVAVEACGRPLMEVFAVVDFRSRKGLAWRAEHDVAVVSLYTLEDFELQLKERRPRPQQRYRQLWHTAVPGGNPYYVVPKSAPLLVENRLYRGCDAGRMQAFDTDSGAIVWEYQVTGAAAYKGIWSSPAFCEGRLYFGAYNGSVYCLDASDGREVWSQGYGEWVGSSPVVVAKHGRVYFGIEYARPWAKGSITALDLSNGEKVWEYETRKLQHGSPAYWDGGDRILWGTADHDMVCLDAVSGQVQWTFPTDRSVKLAPAIDEKRGLLAFASFDKSIYVLDAASGQCRGKWETGEICYTTPLFAADKLFCGSGDRYLYVIDLDRMQILRKLDLGARIYSSPRLVGNRVVVGTNGGRVVEVDVDSLEIQGLLQVPDAITNAIAATADGSRIFVSTYMNHLYAFERIPEGVALLPVSVDRGRPPDISLTVEQHRGSEKVLRADAMNFQVIADNIDIQAIREEIAAQPHMWEVSTTRQTTIKVQRETQSIFLRRAKRPHDKGVALEDTHDSEPTALAQYYPHTMQFIEAFAQENARRIGRVLLAKLKPGGQVYRHVDSGEYYEVRDRFHLVVVSPAGSRMTCDDEDIVMKEGELWWFDNKRPHEAHNPSAEDRIHLIFDLDEVPTPIA